MPSYEETLFGRLTNARPTALTRRSIVVMDLRRIAESNDCFGSYFLLKSSAQSDRQHSAETRPAR